MGSHINYPICVYLWLYVLPTHPVNSSTRGCLRMTAHVHWNWGLTSESTGCFSSTWSTRPSCSILCDYIQRPRTFVTPTCCFSVGEVLFASIFVFCTLYPRRFLCFLEWTSVRMYDLFDIIHVNSGGDDRNGSDRSELKSCRSLGSPPAWRRW